ncbi:hypothetical protein HK102_006760 [Quaeritorhiza haematococci]|nr:hypothetical protein HK102_006760 [Quaeritorhiza haematococci]
MLQPTLATVVAAALAAVTTATVITYRISNEKRTKRKKSTSSTKPSILEHRLTYDGLVNPAGDDQATVQSQETKTEGGHPVPDTPTVFHLSTLDAVLSPRIVLPLVFFFKDTINPERLKQSLAKTLAEFPVLCGRLNSGIAPGKPQQGLNPRYHVVLPSDPNKRNVPFSVSLAVQTTITDILPEDVRTHVQHPNPDPNNDQSQHSHPPAVSWAHKTLPPAIYGPHVHKLHDVTSYLDKDVPLLHVHITQFASPNVGDGTGGGTAIAVTLPHVLVDGESFGHFMKRWAWHTRCLENRKEGIAPTERIVMCTDDILDKYALRPQPLPSSPSNAPTEVTSLAFIRRGLWNILNLIVRAVWVTGFVGIDDQTFWFSPNQLKHLKQLASSTSHSESATAEDHQGFISTNDALSAHIWKQFSLATSPRRPPARISPNRMYIAANIRSRLSPPLTSILSDNNNQEEPFLFGNACIHAASEPHTITGETDLHTLAKSIRKSITDLPTTIPRELSWILNEYNNTPHSATTGGRTKKPRSGIITVAGKPFGSDSDVYVTNWQFGIYEFDFGGQKENKPIWFHQDHRPGMPSLVIVMPAPPCMGGAVVDVSIDRCSLGRLDL